VDEETQAVKGTKSTIERKTESTANSKKIEMKDGLRDKGREE
jgi:hypothetical protein